MYRGYKIVCNTAAGRRRYMQYLFPQVLAADIIDRYDVWVNTIGEVREIDESRRTVKISIPEFMNGAPVSMDFADVAKLN